MATIVLDWIPNYEERDWNTRKQMKDDISAEADVDEMFDLWKRQMTFLGYSMEDFDLIRK